MSIPLSTFYTGGKTMYGFRRGEICKNCKGTGDTTGTLHTCSVCGGSGKMVRKVKVKDQVKEV
jgi:DnaJ-class molecular chaperone